MASHSPLKEKLAHSYVPLLDWTLPVHEVQNSRPLVTSSDHVYISIYMHAIETYVTLPSILHIYTHILEHISQIAQHICGSRKALAQSVRLGCFEMVVEKSIRETRRFQKSV